MRHWPSRGQEKREGGPIPALSVAVADWGGAVPGARCAAVSRRPGASRKPEDAAVCHGPAVGEDRRQRQLATRPETEISRHATQDEATAAAASWRPSR